MEAVASLFSAGTAATVTAATASTTAAAASTWSVLQGVATAASIAATIGGGVIALGESAQQARLSQVEGEQARIGSEQSAQRLRRQWLEQTGAARVAFAASGVDIGSDAAIESNLDQQLNYATAIERENAVIRSLGNRMRTDMIEQRGLASLTSSVGQAGGQVARLGVDIRNRG